jgi:hypothetical protein
MITNSIALLYKPILISCIYLLASQKQYVEVLGEKNKIS